MKADQLKAIAKRLSSDKALEYAPLLTAAMNEFHINTELRVAAFLSQVLVESGELTVWTENLNYSAPRLRQVFPKYFRTDAAAQAAAHKPDVIANLVYANRMGNGPSSSGDGFRYRGRGPMQATGKSMYRALSAPLGKDLIANPEALLAPIDGFRSACWIFAVEKGCLSLADQGTETAIRQITRLINGGYNGLPERLEYYRRARAVLPNGKAPSPEAVTAPLKAEAEVTAPPVATAGAPSKAAPLTVAAVSTGTGAAAVGAASSGHDWLSIALFVLAGLGITAALAWWVYRSLQAQRESDG